MTCLEAVRRALSGKSLPATSEDALQRAIERVLGLAAIDDSPRFAFEREVRLNEDDRIDFMFGDGLGLEVKIDGSLADVTRQLHRYAQAEQVRELLLVTTRARHLSLPLEFNGKRLSTLYLIGSSL